MDADLAISVDNVSKKFCRNLRRSMAYGIKDLACGLTGIRQNMDRIRAHEFWALRDINLEIRRGEAVGVIGVNGSGKTSLFRLVTGIFPPDTGEIRTRGRVGALIALGAGFHPHLSGRENVFLNGAILGIPHAEIAERLDEICDFAEIGEFIDAPVSTYSSGMRVRLGFSVAVNMNPDILLVDEVLAVGDLAFRNKCMRYMKSLSESNCTLLFVSHAMFSVKTVCERVILLDQGRVIADGDANDVITEYYRRSSRHILRDVLKEGAQAPGVIHEMADGRAVIKSACVMDSQGSVITGVDLGSPVTMRMEIELLEAITHVYSTMQLKCGTTGQAVAFTSADNADRTLDPGVYRFDFYLDSLNLMPGLYVIEGGIGSRRAREAIVRGIDLARINVLARPDDDAKSNDTGFVRLEGEWEVRAVGG